MDDYMQTPHMKAIQERCTEVQIAMVIWEQMRADKPTSKLRYSVTMPSRLVWDPLDEQTDTIFEEIQHEFVGTCWDPFCLCEAIDQVLRDDAAE